MRSYVPPEREEPLSYFDAPHHPAPWPRLFNLLKERRETLAESILRGGLSHDDYNHQTGQYVAVTQTIEDMQAMMRGQDLPKRTELPEA